MAKRGRKPKKATERPEMCPADVVELAEEVREAYHAERLEGAVMAYLFVPKGARKGGKISLAHAQKESDKAKLLSRVDFVVCLSKDQWQKLNHEQRRALVDHELCHCEPRFDKAGARIGWATKSHDVEEFAEVIKRHGLWKDDVAEFVEAIRQSELFANANA